MRKLYLDNGDKKFKFADTTTEILLEAFDNGDARRRHVIYKSRQ